MKPAVINNGKNSENSNPNVPQTASNNVQSDTNNNTNRVNSDVRGFPSPFSARGGFGFDDSDDDMFSDMGLRSRMNRMGHPFDWGARKRRGSTGHTEPQPNAYDQYFPDEPDFPGFGAPHWDTFNRKRNQHPTADDRSGFFDYIPPEFRQYMPEHFGFPNMRPHPQMTARSPPSATYQKPPHPQQHQYPQSFQQQQAAPTSPRAKLCDAAIQTEDVVDNAPQTQANNLKQHGLRNTVDLGQKSQQEEVRSDRAHSAPPREDLLAQQKFANLQANVASNIAEDSSGTGVNSGFSNTGTSMTPQCNIQPPQFNAAVYQQQQQQNDQQKKNQHNQPQQSRQPPPPPQRQPQQQYNATGGARTVPIFVEGRDVPLVNKINIPQQVPQTQQQQQYAQQPQQAPKQQNRPAPFVAKENASPQESNEQSQIPPQTPHTTDCINKIQDIQRDVLDLMGKVERFGGLKGDKEYMYLDEMLTRNLLKLDTIDTNGKESIRLARKEAIKCIQASIGVLDAKSEINAKPRENEEAAKPEATTEKDEVKESSSNDNEQEVVAKDSSDLKETDDVKNEPVVEQTSAPKHVSEIKINLGDGKTSNAENLNKSENAESTTNENPKDENKVETEDKAETTDVAQDTTKDKEEIRT